MPKHLHKPPALESGERAALHDRDAIADLGFVFLVMDVEFFHVFDDLSEFLMRHAGDRAHNDCLVHRMGNDLANACLAQVPSGMHGFRRRIGGLRG